MKALVALVFLRALAAESIPVIDPAQNGLGKERLARIAPIMEKHVAANHIPGAIGLIVRNGKIGYFETYGYMHTERKTPMPQDSIFLSDSLTNAVTALPRR